MAAIFLKSGRLCRSVTARQAKGWNIGPVGLLGIQRSQRDFEVLHSIQAIF
ncbi:MAG: hypothetical protein ACREIP_04285 [Alphaproteobacteria bacterium]